MDWYAYHCCRRHKTRNTAEKRILKIYEILKFFIQIFFYIYLLLLLFQCAITHNGRDSLMHKQKIWRPRSGRKKQGDVAAPRSRRPEG